MISARVVRGILRCLDRVPPVLRPSWNLTSRRQLGNRGEEEAYFFLRRQGYVMVGRNYRSPRHHGEIDLIGWDRGVLCFIEVKTRTTRDVKPAEAAVDREKRRALGKVIRDYLQSLPPRQFPELPPWRFDVLTVYYEPGKQTDGRSSRTREIDTAHPIFELFRNASLSS